ncbi:MAG TPA: GntR family transcriptional regulator [Pseudonocardia sp.]|jgi:DNA-binding GntR family transcriptional regulator|nr:GntR family transcriptional regulator [Pseudonocardia sp.]
MTAGRGSRVRTAEPGLGDTVFGGIRIGRVAAPLREQVVEALRNAILNFELQPGQRLVERELIEQTGVSRPTIREVLRELTAEGLVVTVPQKGAMVYRPSPDEARDLYAVRGALEALTVRRFIERASAEQHDRLAATVGRLETDVAASADMPELLRSKDLFYEALLAGAASPTVEQILAGVQARVRLMRATSMSQPGRPARMATEMRALVDAIGARDVELATRLCTEHLEHAAATGLAALAASPTD